MTLQHYITLLLFNSLWIFGLYKLFYADFIDIDYPEHGIDERSKGLFSMVSVWAVKRFGIHFSKPICLCPPCMASIHSTYIFWTAVYLFGSITPVTILCYLFYAVCLSGLNYLIIEILNIEK